MTHMLIAVLVIALQAPAPQQPPAAPTTAVAQRLLGSGNAAGARDLIEKVLSRRPPNKPLQPTSGGRLEVA